MFFLFIFLMFFFLKKYVLSKQFFYDDTNYSVFTCCQLCYSCEIENKFKNSVYFSSHTLTSMTFDPITATHSPICADFYAIIVNSMTACLSCISTNTGTHTVHLEWNIFTAYTFNVLKQRRQKNKQQQQTAELLIRPQNTPFPIEQHLFLDLFYFSYVPRFIFRIRNFEWNFGQW